MQARKIAQLSHNIAVKIPCHADYYPVIRQLVDEGVTLNITLLFSLAQGLMMAKLGVDYISPFVGRLDDISSDGMFLIDQIVQIYRNYDFSTEVLVASIRHPMHLVQAALMGAHVATMPFEVINKIFKHPLTDIGLEKFLSDWKKLK